ncbi:hypothetical protein CERSUDRAFT_24720, partial [Gelatoporia subvermispora B]
MAWSFRKSTRAAQKIPEDAEEQCHRSFARQALTIRNEGVPAELRVNIDQTNVRLQTPADMTYAPTGSKQVSVLGAEEKRAFTLVVGVSASGELLPFQAIWQGKTDRSLPSSNAPGRHEADKLGFRFEHSNTDTYWSTFPLMCKYVETILIPYYSKKKTRLGLPLSQKCVLQLDVWSVHRGAEFTEWITMRHPWIVRDFVPGGCTGL